MSAGPEPSGQGGLRLRVAHSAALGARLPVGASLAVAGVCLSVVRALGVQSEVELSPETIDRTTLGGLRSGDAVNLELALAAGEPLGGHWVQGHVDRVVEVLERRELGEHRVLRLALPAAHRAHVVEKGSLALDGVSLTVAALGPDFFEVALIPHTLQMTTLGALRPGDRANFEADILGKYVERALAARRAESAR